MISEGRQAVGRVEGVRDGSTQISDGGKGGVDNCPRTG